MKKYLMVACLVMSQGAFSGDAVSQLALSKKLSPIKSASQYYQPSKGWHTGDKMEYVNRDNKSFDVASKPLRFHYLTNNSKSDVIKGVVHKYMRGIKQSKYALLDFVVLPGETIYLGRFLIEVDLKVDNAVVVLKENLPALEKSQKLQKERISE